MKTENVGESILKGRHLNNIFLRAPMKGKDIRNALLQIAREITDEEENSLYQWLERVQGFIEGDANGIMWQDGVAEKISGMVADEPRLLRDLLQQLDDVYSVQALGKVIRERGQKHGLSLNRTADGWQVVKTMVEAM